MKHKKWWISLAVLGVLAAVWFGGVIPKGIAKAAGTRYVRAHFPEMQLECTGVEYAAVFGDYLIAFQDKDGNTYSCVIGPELLPISLGQGLTVIEGEYEENYR